MGFLAEKFMNEYLVYFELYGKKMKTVVLASSEQEAKAIIQKKIVFHRVEKKSDPTVDFFKNIFGM